MIKPPKSLSLQVDQRAALRRMILLCAILMSGGNLIIPRLPLLAIMVLSGFFGLSLISSKVHRRKALIYFWVSLVMVTSTLWSLNDDFVSIATRFANFMAGIILLDVYLNNKNRAHLFEDFRSVLLPTVYLGISTFFIASLAPSAFVLLETKAQSMVSLLGIFNYSPPLPGGPSLIRPIGIFWEPGVFSAYLNLLFFVLVIRRDSLLIVSLTAFAIWLTQSTTGIAILLLQTAYFVASNATRRRIKPAELAIIIIGVVAVPLLFTVAQENLSGKLTGSAIGSFSARSFDFETAIQVIKENPFLGIGFSESAYLPYSRSNPLGAFILAEQDLDGRFNTNGIMTVVYSIGVPLAAIYVSAIFRQRLFPHRLLFGVIVLLILLSSPLAMSPFFAFIFFSGMILRTDQTSVANTTLSAP